MTRKQVEPFHMTAPRPSYDKPLCDPKCLHVSRALATPSSGILAVEPPLRKAPDMDLKLTDCELFAAHCFQNGAPVWGDLWEEEPRIEFS